MSTVKKAYENVSFVEFLKRWKLQYFQTYDISGAFDKYLLKVAAAEEGFSKVVPKAVAQKWVGFMNGLIDLSTEADIFGQEVVAYVDEHEQDILLEMIEGMKDEPADDIEAEAERLDNAYCKMLRGKRAAWKKVLQLAADGYDFSGRELHSFKRDRGE